MADAAQPTALVDVDGALARVRLLHVAYRPGPDSELVQVPLSAARMALATGASPVRQPLQYRGQWSKPGWYYFSRLDAHVSYESRFEMYHLLLADFATDVLAVVPQPFRLHWRLDGAPRRHTPDFLIWRGAGTGVVVDVKGTSRASEPGNALVFGVARRACELAGLEFFLATDIDPVLLRNVAWLGGYRTRPHDPHDLASVVVDEVREPTTVDEVLAAVKRRTGFPMAMILPVLFHLLWRRALSADLVAPFTGRTLVAPQDVFPLPTGPWL